jgi:hypothetical protein
MPRQKTTHIHVRRPSGFCPLAPSLRMGARKVKVKSKGNGKITGNSNSNGDGLAVSVESR